LPGLTNLQFIKLCAERFPRDKEFLQWWAGACVAVDNADEAIPLFKRALELDPTYGLALCNLAYAYAEKREWEKSIETFKRYAAVLPGDANVYDSMGDIYTWRGMYDEAVASYKQALAVKSDWFVSAYRLMWCDFVKEDYEGALKWADTCASRGIGHQTFQMWGRALVALWQGRLSEAERLLAKREAMLTKAGQKVDQGADFLNIWIACEQGQFARSRRALDSWAAGYQKRTPEYRPIRQLFVQMCRGFMDIRGGRPDSAATSLAGMDSIRARIPLSDTTYVAKMILSNYQKYSCLLRSEWLMATGRIQEALAAIPRDDPHDLASGTVYAWQAGQSLFPLPMPVMVDLLPRAYLALGELDSSVAAYERAVDHSVNYWPIFPRYHYRLAQVYERKGMKAKAVSEYERFLKIWGKADPIYKEPADARARLAKLKRG
jgi:tetratricopeptide (TPR) repeat protein